MQCSQSKKYRASAGKARLRPNRRSVSAIVMLPVAIIIALLSACSANKNTPMSRQWQAFTTRYNVYYNGDEHYKETLKEMENSYEDDYTRFVLTHPADARADTKQPQPQGDFKRTIEKMQKAIQLHSIKKKPAKKNSSAKEKAFRARDEFNPFIHNAWLMLGKSQYLNGDFLGAASTFFYISKHFTWLPEVVTEAKLWQARSYCALDWDYEAENILRQVKKAQLTNSRLQNLYDLVQADYLVRKQEYEKAVPFLSAAAKSASGSQKNRLYFLLGQVYAQLQKKKLAYEAFRKAGSGIATAYRTKFNARIKQSEVFTGGNISSEVRALKALTRYERNNEYLDQIYYAIGNLYLSHKDTAEAKKNYLLAVEKSTRNGIDKALAQLALGNIYFNEEDYVKAQPCYSEAVPQLPKTYPDYDMLKRRSDVLDELGVYAGNVQLQDSLLTLSKMTPDEQLKVAERLVAELIKKEKEEAAQAKREEFLANRDDNSLIGQNTPSTPTFNGGDNSWYFYNTTVKNSGKTEFQRRWGARKLEDDWRRRNKSTFSLETEEEEQDSEIADTAPGDAPLDSVAANQQKEKAKLESDPHNPEYYLKDIPKTEEEIKNSNDIIQEGLYNMGVILKDKLEDFPAARKEFMLLDTRYPDNIYRLDAYYNLYLMAVRENNPADAEKWRRLIIEEFPESPYGMAMTDPDYFTNLRTMHERQEEMYEEAYDAYLSNKNNRVHKLTENMEKDYPLSPILPKFVFIDALSYLTQGDNDEFRKRLEYLLDKWPDTDMTPMAGSILKGLKEGRVPNAGMENTRGMLWDTRLTASDNGIGGGGPAGPAAFERNPDSPQYLVFAFARDSVSANQVLYDVARFNFSSFVVKDFDLEQMSFGNVGLLIVKGFANMRELEHYREVMARKDFNLPEGVRIIMISKPNFELLLREGRSFEEYFRFEEQSELDAKEEEVIGESLPLEPLDDDPDHPDDDPADHPADDPDSEKVPEAPAAQSLQ